MPHCTHEGKRQGSNGLSSIKQHTEMYGAVDCITVSSSTVHGLLYSGKLSREKKFNVYEFAVSEPSMKASGKMKF